MLFFKSKDERYVIKTVKEYVVFFWFKSRNWNMKNW
jgi:hypothetical protein